MLQANSVECVGTLKTRMTLLDHSVLFLSASLSHPISVPIEANENFACVRSVGLFSKDTSTFQYGGVISSSGRCTLAAVKLVC